MENTRKIKPLTKTELAAMYGVCLKTFNKWIHPFLDEIGANNKTYIYTVLQVQTIYKVLGDPGED